MTRPPCTRGRRARRLALVAALAACGPGAARRADEPADPARPGAGASDAARPGGAPARSDCDQPPSGALATPLRGPIAPPDPRVPETLAPRGYALDADGFERALVATGDATAQLAALTAVTLYGCHQLLPRVEALLGAPPPTAVEAAATLAELGTPAQRARALERLRRALGDPAWPEVQVTAAVYLGRAGDAAAVPALQAALRSETEAIRLQAVVSISALAGFDGRTVEGRAFTRLGELDAVLADPGTSWLVRREAVYQVARLPASSERRALLARVAERDPDERVRRAAALRVDRP